jgi:hypothetical protein
MRIQGISKYVGKKFGKLTVLKIIYFKEKLNRKFVVLCDCGNVKEVWYPSVVQGNKTSCGCQSNFKAGGLSNKPIYQRYRYFKKKHPEICPPTVQQFINDIGKPPEKNHSLKVVDGKIVWSRKISRKFITFNGKTQSEIDWSKEIGITRQALSQRLKKLSIEEALTKKKNNIKFYEINGEKHSIEQLSRLHQIPVTTLYNRIHKFNFTVESALSRPVKKNGAHIRKCAVCKEIGHNKRTCKSVRDNLLKFQ